MSDDGSALLLGLNVVALIAIVAVLVVELTAYFAAAGRAQGAADAAALAAVAVTHPQRARSGDPRAEARRVTDGWGARLDRCRCRPGSRRVEVAVSVEVRALLVTRFAGRRVTATAQATMAPP